MTDEEYRQQVQQRWKESMALLGLDDAGPAPEPPKAEPVKTQPTPAAPLPVQEDAADVHAEADWPAARHEAEPVEPEAFQAEPAPTEPVDEFELTNEPGEAPRPEPESSEDQQGRRRRGRRGRRGGRDESTPGPTDGPDTSEGRGPARDSSEEDSRQRGRGRGRGRPRPVKPAEVEDTELDEPVTDEPAADRDFGDDEPTDFSEWNVPSWQELIASLYRPER
jgi:hypothetical protein